MEILNLFKVDFLRRILNIALLLGASLVIYQVLGLMRIRLDNELRTWNKLTRKIGLEGYHISDKSITKRGLILIVKLPIGGTIKRLEDMKDNIQKTFSCIAIIEDIPFSNCVKIELITNEVEYNS